MSMKKKNLLAAGLLLGLAAMLPAPAEACTGITLTAADGSQVVARTIEWGGSDLNSGYVIVPRGYAQQSMVAGGAKEGKAFKARYGYVGLTVEMQEFVAEGLNEAGLSAGLFYFPAYGKYVDYDPARKAESVADLQLVSYVLSTCATLDEVKEAVAGVQVVAIDPRASTVHWRFADKSGKQIVLEIVDGKLNFYDNELGVLTNSPGFEWQMTNLNNYVNLYPGSAQPQTLGRLSMRSFGAGSGMLGLPGDVTPPSRFVRAAFFQATAPQQATGLKAALQGFQILNNFDIPVGVEFAEGKVPADIPSATQWTSATDITNRVVYFRTMYDSRIRSLDLNKINFGKVKYKFALLDAVKQQPVTPLI